MLFPLPCLSHCIVLLYIVACQTYLKDFFSIFFLMPQLQPFPSFPSWTGDLWFYTVLLRFSKPALLLGWWDSGTDNTQPADNSITAMDSDASLTWACEPKVITKQLTFSADSTCPPSLKEQDCRSDTPQLNKISQMVPSSNENSRSFVLRCPDVSCWSHGRT